MNRIALSLLVLLSLVLGSCNRQGALPVLYPVPAAELVNDDGRAFKLDELRGSVAVVGFVFTRCAGPCPLMAASMKKIAAQVPADVRARFVLVSVDPSYDTPEVLHRYRKTLGVDDRWVLLTGTEAGVTALSVEGFKLALTRTEGVPMHSTRFALVDRNGMIRGYYDGVGPDGSGALVRDLMRLSED